ncbi:MAG TPA: DUF4157 domain-containing protein [Acidobacteriota bacterium]|nr:DUF4157 domain-containing protein [Acidobacteriota bacterium]
MSRQLLESAQSTPRSSGLLLQRKCKCGQHTGSEECKKCRKKRAGIQKSDKDRPASSLGGLALGQDFSRIGVNAKDKSHALPALRSHRQVQQATEEAAGASSRPAAAEPVAEGTPESAASAEAGAGPGAMLIVEDESTDLQPGQMRKSEFLARLRTEACASAEAAMAGTGQTTEGCPQLDFWFKYYANKSSAHVEAALRRFAPETAQATTAQGYIPLVAARIARSVQKWSQTGEVPEGMSFVLGGGGLLGAVGGLVSGAGSLLFKAREGGARDTRDPQQVQEQLGEGRPLESGVRSRMESAFGRSFSQVRTHTDSAASGLSNDLNARAFTVGRHVAFGPGEYKPGTPVGDALIAHELAHVVQQGDASSSAGPQRAGSARYGELEADADEAAGGAVASLWGGAKGRMAEMAGNAIPNLRSGLRLQRCSSDSKKSDKVEMSTLCDDNKCLKRSGCSTDDCKSEAKTIKDTYVKRVKAIRRPDMPNRGDIHWGWMCYQWAGLLNREFEKLSTKCWQMRWVGIVGNSGSGALEHNYIFTSLGDPKGAEGPVRDCGVVFDPWRTGEPVVYGGAWDWHKWNYIHDAKNNTGKVFKDGRWQDVTFTPSPSQPPMTTPEPSP